MESSTPELPQLILRLRPDETVILSRTDRPGKTEFPSLEAGLEHALRQTRSDSGRVIVYDWKGNPIIRT